MRRELPDPSNEHACAEVASADRLQSTPDEVSREDLHSLVTMAFPHLTLKALKFDGLPFGGDGVSGVWRITAAGPPESSTDTCWSCIAKSYERPSESAMSTCEALQNELRSYHLNFLSGGGYRLRMPRLLKLANSRGRRTLLLEDIAGAHRRPLEIHDLCDFGYQLGAWHARMKPEAQSGRPNRWLSQYVTAAEPLVASIPTYASKISLMAPLTVEPGASEANAVWAGRHHLLRALAAAPQTICHQDLVANNVLVTPESSGMTYHLIDWSTFGSAPVGAELAPLLIGNALLFRWSLESSMAVTSELISAYRRGLASQGLSISAPVIRFCLMASAALRYIAWGGHRIEAVINPSRQHLAQSVTGHSIADMVENYAAIRQQVTAWGQTALQHAYSSSIDTDGQPL